MTSPGSAPGLRRRRLAATLIDYGCVAAGAVALFAIVSALVDPGVGGFTPGPVLRHVLSLLLLVAPATIVLGLTEASGGTPGKRVAGIGVRHAEGHPVSRGRALARTALKVALPWELAHYAVWELQTGPVTPAAVVALAVVYTLVIAAVAALLLGRRPWHDVLAGTTVSATRDPT